MSKPVFLLDGYVVTFEAEPEHMNKRNHFRKECGWTEAQYRQIERFPWFSAKVTLWKDGKELATDYLGGCCYKTEDEFWTRYKADYFADMVHECFCEAALATHDRSESRTLRELADKARLLLRGEK